MQRPLGSPCLVVSRMTNSDNRCLCSTAYLRQVFRRRRGDRRLEKASKDLSVSISLITWAGVNGRCVGSVPPHLLKCKCTEDQRRNDDLRTTVRFLCIHLLHLPPLALLQTGPWLYSSVLCRCLDKLSYWCEMSVSAFYLANGNISSIATLLWPDRKRFRLTLNCWTMQFF